MPVMGNTGHRTYNTTVGTMRNKTLDCDLISSCSNTKRTRDMTINNYEGKLPSYGKGYGMVVGVSMGMGMVISK